QVGHIHQGTSDLDDYCTHRRSVVARWKICNDCRLQCVTRSVTAIDDILNLVVGDDSTDDCVLPVVVKANESSGTIVQFQCGISQWRRHPILTEFRTNGPYNDSLCSCALDDESADHHVITRLHKAASTDVAKSRSGVCYNVVYFDQS